MVVELQRFTGKKVTEAGFRNVRTLGDVVDLGGIVVHVMQAAVRSYYNLEELWGGKGPERVRKATAAMASRPPAVCGSKSKG